MIFGELVDWLIDWYRCSLANYVIIKISIGNGNNQKRACLFLLLLLQYEYGNRVVMIS